ncbi:MAG: ATP-binding cassette domain-containing protein [Gemmatimonadota bacterium]
MLEIRSLIKVYPGQVAALQGVDLEIPEGMFGLVGPNGSGKTTLMRIVAGLLEATSGEVHLDGEDILADPARVWSKLGYLPQDFGFYPHLTGEAMLRHILELKGVTGPNGVKAAVADLLEAVNLAPAARQKIKAYSGGMLQRLGIAQAIAGDPRLMIVDEPTAGLDPEERLRFYRVLAELAQDRIVLLSTHIVEDVAVLCRRFAVIRNGVIIARTTPAEARAAIDGAVFEGEVTAEELQDLHLTRTVTQSLLSEGRHRLRIYEPHVDPPPGFREVPPSLEDAYLVMMRTGGVPGAVVPAQVGGSGS